MTSSDMDKYKLAKCRIWSGIVNAGQCLYVPWGFLICESSLNGAEVIGVRYMVVDDRRSSQFDALLSKLIPTNVRSIKANTSIAMVAKLIDAQNRAEATPVIASTEPTLSMIMKKVKEEQNKSVIAKVELATKGMSVASASGPP